jgi:hypothetical protein
MVLRAFRYCWAVVSVVLLVVFAFDRGGYFGAASILALLQNKFLPGTQCFFASRKQDLCRQDICVKLHAASMRIVNGILYLYSLAHVLRVVVAIGVLTVCACDRGGYFCALSILELLSHWFLPVPCAVCLRIMLVCKLEKYMCFSAMIRLRCLDVGLHWGLLTCRRVFNIPFKLWFADLSSDSVRGSLACGRILIHLLTLGFAGLSSDFMWG